MGRSGGLAGGRWMLPLCLALSCVALQSRAAPTPEELLQELGKRCEPWLRPSSKIRSLRYMFELDRKQDTVAVVRGMTDTTPYVWRGIRLRTGLDQLLASPNSYEVAVQEGDAQHLTVVARKRDEPFSLRLGHGVAYLRGGEFGSTSDEMTVKLRRDVLLPVAETHEDTEILYENWLKVGADQWVPQRIDVLRGIRALHMRFQWYGGLLWILEHSEYEWNEQIESLMRVYDIVINDGELIVRVKREAEQTARGPEILKRVLEHNKTWVQPQLKDFESIQYTFRTVPEDVNESCFVGRDGVAVVEVTRDEREEAQRRFGARWIAVPSGDGYRSTHGQQYATPWAPARRSLRRCVTIGVRLALPLLSYLDKLEDVTARDRGRIDWQGRSCHVVDVSGPREFHGAGTMLNFAPSSYIRNIRAKRDHTIYIDTERHVPLHERLISGSRAFEIDYKDYAEMTPGQWAPMRIEVSARDYFTCHYNFQLVGDRHWMLKDVISWFDAEAESRGEILDVRINEPSTLREQALAQVKATRQLLAAPSQTGSSIEVVSYPFRVGKWIPVTAHLHDAWTGRSRSEEGISTGSAIKEVLFTLNEDADLVARCKFVSRALGNRFHMAINAALYGEGGDLLGADSLTTTVAVRNDIVIENYTLNFGRHDALGQVKRFSVHLEKARRRTDMLSGAGWMTTYDPWPSGVKDERVKKMLWDLADGLTADDPALRSVALARLFFYSEVTRTREGAALDAGRVYMLLRDKWELTSAELFPRDARRELLEPLLWLRQRTTEPSERTRIATMLAWFDDAAAKPALIDSFENRAGAERRAAAASLGILGDGRGLDGIIAALTDENEGLRMNAVWALATLGGRGSVEALCAALFHQEPWLEPAQGGGAILHDPYRSTREDIIRALLLLRDKTCLPALRELEYVAREYDVDADAVRLFIRYIEGGDAGVR